MTAAANEFMPAVSLKKKKKRREETKAPNKHTNQGEKIVI
jgi:hypothetical protein